MGWFRDYADVAGGLRSGLSDEPPGWARVAMWLFAAVVVAVMAAGVVLGVGETPGSPTRPAPDGAAPPTGSTVATVPPEGSGPQPAAPGTTAGGGDDATGTVALADEDGVFRRVPQAAVAAARDHGAGTLGLPVDAVRHQLVRAAPGRVELAVSSLDGDERVHVVVTRVDGAWQVT